MSTTEVLGRSGADLQSTDERARAAVKTFHRMQPSLTAYARALIGKSDVQVVVSPNSNGHTDGKKIFYRPPLSLGDNTQHQRAQCDKRDHDTGRQQCPACDIREQVLIVIYHEIAHIAFGSFEEMRENDRAEALKYGLSLVDKKYAAAVMERVRMAPERVKATYIGMSGLISPYLPGIVNALEDARVNASAARARKGTKVMFQVDTMRVLSEGFEQKMPDGSVQQIYWRNRPLNAQMICALYARAAGYKVEDHFVPEVNDALDDAQVREILSDFPTIRNAKGVYAVAIALLMRLRELGFYQHHTDPTPESDEEQQDDETQDDSGDSSDGDGVGSPEPSSEDDSERESGQGDGPPQEDQADSGTEDSGSEPSEADDAHPGDEDSDGGTEESESGSDGDGSDEQAPADDGGSSPSEEEGADGSDGSGESQGSDSGDDASDDTGSSAGSDDTGTDDSESADVSDAEREEGVGDDGGEAPTESGDSSGAPEGGELSPQGDAGDDEDREGDASGTGDDHEPSSHEDLSSSDDRGDLGEGTSEDVGTGESGTGTAESDLSAGAEVPGGADLAGTYPEGTDEEPSDSLAEDSQDGDSTGGRDDTDSTSESIIDTGADEGLGGVEVIEDSAFDRLPMGTPEEVNETIHEVAHPEERPERVLEAATSDKEMEVAVIQGLYFETPSREIHGVREHYYDSPIIVDGHNMSGGWDDTRWSWGYTRTQLGVDGDFECDEKTLGPALLRMRVAFADNQRGHDMRHRKSGKVDPRVLGKRARLGDERLFKRRIIPGKKDYFVLIGVDISGSTIGRNIVLAKRAAMAQAELCARMGINFAVYAHSGNYHMPDYGRSEGMDLEIYHIKDPDEPWTSKVKERLNKLGPDSANLDGHTFEYYRKILDTRTETHRVMLYYTDGKMPAENHDEELEILQREIKICRQRKYVLLGVGIRTDSPVRHGLDTVQVDGDEDVVKVVKHLEKRLLEIA